MAKSIKPRARPPTAANSNTLAALLGLPQWVTTLAWLLMMAPIVMIVALLVQYLVLVALDPTDLKAHVRGAWTIGLYSLAFLAVQQFLQKRLAGWARNNRRQARDDPKPGGPARSEPPRYNGFGAHTVSTGNFRQKVERELPARNEEQTGT